MEKRGMWYAFGAYVAWGLFPIYWKWLKEVNAIQLISHRILWSFIFLMIFVLITGQIKKLFQAAADRKVLLIYFFASLLIGINWLIYVWAVNAGYIVETSLGYFINPLLSVLLGVIFLKERLRIWQWIALSIAAFGVVYLSIIYGRLPWIALSLAFSFGTYGLIKKISPLGSLYGLTIETGILFIPALIYLSVAEFSGTGAFLHAPVNITLLLVGAGLVTTIPLLMFAKATSSIPLTMVGVMQYIAPSIQFMLGVWVYKEQFDQNHFIGFVLVWTALVAFLAEGFYFRYRRQP